MQIVTILAGEKVGNAVLPQFGQIFVRDLFTENSNRVVAQDMVFAIVQFPLWVDGDRNVASLAISNVDFTQITSHCFRSPSYSVDDVLHGYSADNPAIGLKTLG